MNSPWQVVPQVAQTVSGVPRMDTISRRLRHFVVMIAMLFAASYGACQISTGAFNGTVTDSTGAVIEGATVTIINTETNVQRSTRTN